MIIKNGLTAFSGEEDLRPADLRVLKGVIAEIGQDLVPRNDETLIDADGLWVFPGGIDPHVHFYDPGYTDKEDFSHGTAAAASGGITTVIDMPCTSVPPVTDQDSLNHKLSIVQPKASIDFAFFGGISRQLFDQGCFESMKSIARRVCGFKVYAVSGMDEIWGALDHWRFRRVLEMAKELNTKVLLHAEDREYVDHASGHYRSLGKQPLQWYESRPELAEILAVQSALRINAEVGGDLHIVHIGTGEAARQVGKERCRLEKAAAEGRYQGRLSGETCPQYLAFGLEDFKRQGAVLKIAPPVKQEINRELLMTALSDDDLLFIASDHAPGTEEDKAPGDIWCNSAGIAGVSTIFPFLFSMGYRNRKLTLSRFLQVMCENAPKRYGFFDRKGSIGVGKDADLVLIDPRQNLTVRGDRFLSKGKVTPFEGQTFQGRILRTMVRGKTVFAEGGETGDASGWGRLVEPGTSDSRREI